ncbi:MAG TPA: 2,3-bisphosphoglycerate-independent phosphoglycerate mutase [Nitrospiria bacterium]|nr:2,3-bisphosphoglycerate-independent phosphoglycerate mutase [Nitrospiria bacterium]
MQEWVRPLLLIVLDGWGINKNHEGNAIALARKPFYNSLIEGYPNTGLLAAGEAVGLPEGQMGNSEVGHLNLGAGRVVYQDLTRINRSIRDGSFYKNQALIDGIKAALSGSNRLHLLGLLSDGGVHSSIDHLFSLTKMVKGLPIRELFFHVILDGRDTPPFSGLGYTERLEKEIGKYGIGTIATIMGRYYAMDRDNRWDRIEKAYDAMVTGKGEAGRSVNEIINRNYSLGIGDEFVVPSVILDERGRPAGRIEDGDSVIFFNFRADRAREITRALTDKGFNEFKRGEPPHLSSFVCMTSYDEGFDLPVAFGKTRLDNIFPEVISNLGLRQMRIAETEKYAHVTYFFNGGDEKVYPGEERVLIPSPRDVPTYDLKPEMSAREVTYRAVKELSTNLYKFILVNYANPDMVGHTGIMPAAIRAVEIIDECLNTLITAAKKQGWIIFITADHGNIEQVVEYKTNEPHTAHTLNKVPLIVIDHTAIRLRDDGILADVAPTIMDIMGIKQPEEMSGNSLIKR